MRKLRHGPLHGLEVLWLPLGRAYRLLVQRFNPRFAVSQRIGGYGPFRLDPYFAFSDFANWGSGHNDGFAACIEACRGRRCMIDVGAHVGLVTLPVASVLNPGGVVVAFEPSGVNRKFLERHVARNDFGRQVRIEPMLVGACERDAVPLFEIDEPSGMNSVVSEVRGVQAHKSLVSQTTIDTYCTRHGLSPDVIKIDVEGAELDVLAGAKQVMLRARPAVFLSVHPRQIGLLGRTIEELLAIIESCDYDCRHIDGSAVESFALREYWLLPRKSKTST